MGEDGWGRMGVLGARTIGGDDGLVLFSCYFVF